MIFILPFETIVYLPFPSSSTTPFVFAEQQGFDVTTAGFDLFGQQTTMNPFNMQSTGLPFGDFGTTAGPADFDLPNTDINFPATEGFAFPTQTQEFLLPGATMPTLLQSTPGFPVGIIRFWIFSLRDLLCSLTNQRNQQ